MNKTVTIVVILIILCVGLIYWSNSNNPKLEMVKTWQAAGINCLVQGEVNLQTHIHPFLSITVNGDNETIPANTGITQECFSDIHTHDTTGTLHVESYVRDRVATLGQFLTVLDKPIIRKGYNLTILVDNATSTAYDKLVLKDQQKIELRYTSTSL